MAFPGILPNDFGREKGTGCTNQGKSPSEWVSQKSNGAAGEGRWAPWVPTCRNRQSHRLGAAKQPSPCSPVCTHTQLESRTGFKGTDLFYPQVLRWVICAQDPLSHFWSASSLQGKGLDLPLPSPDLFTFFLSTPRVCGTTPSPRSGPPKALGLPSVITGGNEISSWKKKMTCQLGPDNICLAPEWI